MAIALAVRVTTPGTETLGSLLARAMRDKSAADGEPYSLRDLNSASGVDYSFISRVISGERNASPEIIRSLAQALKPHLSVDQALVAAGYMPDSPTFREAIRQMIAASDHAARRAADSFGGLFTTPPPIDEQSGSESDGDSQRDAESDDLLG